MSTRDEMKKRATAAKTAQEQADLAERTKGVLEAGTTVSEQFLATVAELATKKQFSTTLPISFSSSDYPNPCDHKKCDTENCFSAYFRKFDPKKLTGVAKVVYDILTGEPHKFTLKPIDRSDKHHDGFTFEVCWD